jgi:hypothetical protein
LVLEEGSDADSRFGSEAAAPVGGVKVNLLRTSNSSASLWPARRRLFFCARNEKTGSSDPAFGEGAVSPWAKLLTRAIHQQRLGEICASL